MNYVIELINLNLIKIYKLKSDNKTNPINECTSNDNVKGFTFI